MDKDLEIELIRKIEEHRLKPKIDLDALDRRHQIMCVALELAKSGDVETFKDLLTHTLGIIEGTPAYDEALASFWTVRREFEKRVRGRL